MSKTLPTYSEYSGFSKGNIMNNTSTDSKIIQCPACQTKFAIKLSAIEGLSFPRYHCSRCDNVFGDEQQIEIELGNKNTTNSDFENKTNIEKDFNEPEFNNDYEPSPFQPEEEHFGTAYQADDAFIDQPITNTTTEENQGTITGNWTLDADDANINKANFNKIEETIKEPDQTSFNWHESSAEAPLNTEKSNIPASTTSQMELVLNPGIRRKKFHENQEIDSPNFKNPINEINMDSNDDNKITIHRPSKISAFKDNAKALAKKIPNFKFPQLSLWDNKAVNLYEKTSAVKTLSKWRSLQLISLPVVIALFLLGLLGFFAGQSPQSAFSFAKTLSASLPDVPPSDLVLTKTKHKIVELESGERIHVISGEIKNKGNKTFKNVKVQGILFNQSNKPVETQLVEANSSLVSARIQSLSWEMIQNLMNTPSSRRLNLAADETAKFTLALNIPAKRKVAHFSARIYSVL
jgi:predicted Zn finger-like uncharacterized protein